MKTLTGQLRFWKNPILVKEIRTRMRGNRAFLFLSIHLVILVVAVILAYLAVLSVAQGINLVDQRRSAGKTMFGLVIGMEVLLVSFAAPALTSGAIAQERERQTYDLLRVTLLPARTLVAGKLLSGLVFIFLLLFTSIPMQSPAFLVGGVALEEILIASLVIGVMAVSFCAVGIFLSCLVKRTLVATIISYAFATFFVFGLPVLILVIAVLVSSQLNLLTGGRSSAFYEVIGLLTGWLLVSLTPTGALVVTEAILLDQHQTFLATVNLSNGATISIPAPWLSYVTFYLIVSLVLFFASVQLVKRLDTS